MKKEKIIMSFAATLIGLLVAGIVFYLYESSSKIAPKATKTISIASPSPSPTQTIFLTIDSPKDEEVFTQKTITISGQTTHDAIVSIISKNSQDIITPSQNGDFSTTININDGQNIIEITAIDESGQSAKVTKTVTFSTEEF